MGGAIRLSRNDHDTDFWLEVCQMYERGQFCDLRLLCGDGEESLGCHGLILSLVSPFVAKILAEEKGEGGETVLLLPDFDRKEVSSFLDDLYAMLRGENGALKTHSGLQRALLGEPHEEEDAKGDIFGVEQTPDVIIKEEEVEEFDSGDVDEDYSPLKHHRQLPLKRKRRRRTETTKKKKRSPAKRTKKLPEEEEEEEEEDTPLLLDLVDSLESRLRACEGALEDVCLEEAPFDQLRNLRQLLFVSALGLKRGDSSGGGDLRCLPLAWSAPPGAVLAEREVARQYGLYCDALRAVLGLSKAETYYQANSLARMGFKSKRGLLRLRYTTYA